MVQFLSINFFSWISSIFVRFFKSSYFFVSPCITLRYLSTSRERQRNFSSLYSQELKQSFAQAFEYELKFKKNNP